jgi:hypothetical protein
VTNATAMTTKRQNYTIIEKLKIIKRDQNGKVKASLICNVEFQKEKYGDM